MYVVRPPEWRQAFADIRGNIARDRTCEAAALCLALLFFFIANGLDAFLFRPYRDGRQEEGTVVTAHAGMAPNDLEKEEQTHFITPSLRSGRVQLFSLATIGAFVQSNFTNEDSTITSRSAVVLGVTTPAAPLLSGRCNWHGWPRTVSPRSRLSFVRVGGE